ncbi:MAG TPA: DUF3299 domain-containing protein [Longimicrobiales bacterium]|nr:DUF3299 domain-containing protein [Longimicrobiales bacterium]
MRSILRHGAMRASGVVALVPILLLALAPAAVSADPDPGAELRAAIRSSAGTAEDPIELSWRQLAELDYENGEMSDILREADGKVVKIPGFTVPLEDFANRATEFLLVPYVGACVHTPPPPPNQLVYIEMADGEATQLYGWDPVWLEGTLRIEMTESVYGSVGYVVEGTRLYPYEYN